MALLDSINEPNDIKELSEEAMPELCREIRRFLLGITSRNGGHVASNLGAVELTVALHRVLDFPKDKIIWDVGHQAYTHKLLTGRKEALLSLRQKEGPSGFPLRSESECDAFGCGHSSTSISAALGFAKARELKGTDEKIVAVIGDGALTGGMALEALNNTAELSSNLLIVLNDNERSISENVGGMANYLGNIRTSKNYTNLKKDVENALNSVPFVGEKIANKIRASKDSIKRLFVPGMFFEDMGLTYIGPIDGHNVREMETAFKSGLRVNGPVLVHVITKKGKGYRAAEDHPAKFHGVDPFYIKSGDLKEEKQGESYTEVFSKELHKLIDENRKIVAVTAAMPYGTGLYDIKKSFPENFVDVGIAEEHAVTYAAGLAAAGFTPVVAIYSTFLQRAFDQIIHDVALQGLHVVFMVDRAGLVGKDGATHQGTFDEAFLTLIPGLTVMSPKNAAELCDMLRFAVNEKGPVVIRYPKGQAFTGLSGYREPVASHKNEIIINGEKIAILATGVMTGVAMDVWRKLAEDGLNASVVNIRFLDSIDKDLLRDLSKNHTLLVTLEEVVRTGSYGERAAAVIAEEGIYLNPLIITLPNEFIRHASVNEQREEYGLTADAVYEKIKDRIG